MKNKISDLLFRGFRILGRTAIRLSSNPRPGSHPYISGDGFRALATHVYDNAHPSFDPKSVKENDIVFVGDSRTLEYLKELHPQIESPYILITHNGDEQVDDERAALAADKVIRWYGINVTTSHPKIVPLPLGIENKHFYVCGIPMIFDRVIRKKHQKIPRIFYGFTVGTNTAERQPALTALTKHPLADTVVKWMNFPSYLHLLATYQYVASPPGSSVEGHRTWDALYIGTIPIVKSSLTTEYFKKIGVPMWVVGDWREIDGVSEKDLDLKYKAIMSSVDRSLLHMDYWTDKILHAKD